MAPSMGVAERLRTVAASMDRALRLIVAFMAGALWILVVVDYKVFDVLGLRLLQPYTVRLLLHEASLRDLAVGRTTMVSALAGIAVLTAAHSFVLALLERRRKVWTPRISLLMPMVVVILAPLAALGTVGSRPSARFFAKLRAAGKAMSVSPATAPLSYPAPGLAVPTLERQVSVLVVLVDSLRGDVWGPALMPELHAMSQQLPCLVSANHFSSSHETFGGLFSVLYGLNAYYRPAINSTRTRSWPLAVLHRNGYHCVAATATRLAGHSPSDFWMSQFDIYSEAISHQSYLDDIELVRSLSAALRTGHLRRPFFAFAFINSTHHNYDYAPEFERYLPVLAKDYDHFLGDHKVAPFRAEIVNRYRNSVLFADNVVAGLIRDLQDDIERGDVVVAIAGDHGEEFWDHGLLGHVAPHLIDARIRVPFLLFARGVSGSLGRASSHVDILPTVLDILHTKPPIDPASYSDGTSLLESPSAPERVVVISAADQELGDLRLALVGRRHKFQVDVVGVPGQFVLRRVTDLRDNPVSIIEGRRELSGMLPGLERGLFRFVVQGPPAG